MTENNKLAKKKRPPPTNGFKKGQSGNPGGRPALTPEELDLIAACKAKTPAALDVLEEIMVSGKSDSSRLAAALAIIERGYGKPIAVAEVNQNVNVTHGGIVEHRSVSEIGARITELLASRSEGDQSPSMPH